MQGQHFKGVDFVIGHSAGIKLVKIGELVSAMKSESVMKHDQD